VEINRSDSISTKEVALYPYGCGISNRSMYRSELPPHCKPHKFCHFSGISCLYMSPWLTTESGIKSASGRK